MTMQRRQFVAAVASAGWMGSGCSSSESRTPDRKDAGIAVPQAEKSTERQIDYCLELDQPDHPMRVKETRTFHSGERFRFLFRPGFDSHLYLLNRGPQENFWTVLFPGPKIAIQNPIHPGSVVTVPDEDTGWLRIDNKQGNEHLVLIASSNPLKEFAGTADRISRDDFEDRLADIERLYRPSSSRRFEDDGWVKLFAAGNGANLAIVLNVPLLHG
jgi:hypothetical protein